MDEEDGVSLSNVEDFPNTPIIPMNVAPLVLPTTEEEDETPKVFGKVFISLKPKANYFLSETEKQRIIDEIVNPKAIVSVAAEIRDPEILYLLVNSIVQYDPRKTTVDEETIKAQLKQYIILYKIIWFYSFMFANLENYKSFANRNSFSLSSCPIECQQAWLD
jgi:hypothetical protein